MTAAALKTHSITVLLTFAALLATATSHAATYTLSGGIDVSQAITNSGLGAGDGSGSGLIAGTYDDASNLLDYTITWQDLLAPGEVTNMHFHVAPEGSGGGVGLAVPSPWTSPLSQTGIALDDAKETDLLAGNWYVNIHTSNFGGGEIRGQVLVTPVPEPASATLAGMLCIIGMSVVRRWNQ